VTSGTASVLAVKYEDGKITRTEQTYEVLLGAGSEPWQVVIAPDSDTAYVVLRKDQKLVRLRHLSTKPVVDGYVAVGSEPTSLALSPSGRTAYVTNWTDGTVSVVDTSALEVTSTIDLNPALVRTGYLGDVEPRAALAHPRSITVTNDGDYEDGDESLLVTEYFAQQIRRASIGRTERRREQDRRRLQGEPRRLRGQHHHPRPHSRHRLQDVNGNPAGCFPNSAAVHHTERKITRT